MSPTFIEVAAFLRPDIEIQGACRRLRRRVNRHVLTLLLGVRHMLQASEIAAYCLPDDELARSSQTRELAHLGAMTFAWWDAVVGSKRTFDLETWRPSS